VKSRRFPQADQLCTTAEVDSAFNGGPSYAALLTMVVYTVIFAFIAIRYFRWE
jgi:hypothetical protein